MDGLVARRALAALVGSVSTDLSPAPRVEVSPLEPALAARPFLFEGQRTGSRELVERVAGDAEMRGGISGVKPPLGLYGLPRLQPMSEPGEQAIRQPIKLVV